MKEDFYKEIKEYPQYISCNDFNIFRDKYSFLYRKIKKKRFKSIKDLFFIYCYKNDDYLRKRHNKIFMKNNLNNHLLDNINGYSLDNNQRKAVLSDCDNTLIVAGAGTGKTLTLIAKITYLIEEKKIKEEDILYISFTNAVTKSIKEKIKYNIDIMTFHKLALTIIGEKSKINIASHDLLEYIIHEYFYNSLLSNDIKLLVLKYFDFDNYDRLLNSNLLLALEQLIAKFIHLFKANSYTKEEFYKYYIRVNSIFNKKERIKNIIFIKLVKDIYDIYEEELSSNNTLDFDDLINKATILVKENNLVKRYKYIMIDEYQDTSYTRYLFIKSILDKTKSKFIAVGDDFQSIYRFSGCSLEIFLNFNKYFKKPNILKIVNTYRSPQELIDIAGSFVMKNKRQLNKRLISNKHLNKPIILVYNQNLKSLIDSVEGNVLILGRNNKDIYKYLKDIKLDNDGYFKIDNRKVRYLTVHKSKGLEEDNIIIINLEDKLMGFPNKMLDDKILCLVNKTKNYYPYEEERRLFYVALTRSKNKVYLLLNKESISIFVKEIMNECDSMSSLP